MTLHVLVLCGGQSTEHEISIISARNVVASLDKTKYHVSIAYILPDGRWLYIENHPDFLEHDVRVLAAKPAAIWMHVAPGNPHCFIVTTSPSKTISVDCVFPMLHGTRGEDGAMQGFLEILNVPYVGADVLGSAVIMDKSTTKKLLHEAGLPIVPYLVVTHFMRNQMQYADVSQQLGRTLFIKPNSLGSSVGISKVKNEKEFVVALENAFHFDDYVLIEKAISAREIECSVLGNDQPICSLPGEVINHTEFYTYAAKYLEENAATIQTPAPLSTELITRFQDFSIRAYQATRCLGMARVDFFLENNNTIYISELNTIPGFTPISLYPKNWEVSGIAYTELLDRLIALGLQQFQSKKLLNRVYDPNESVAENVTK